MFNPEHLSPQWSYSFLLSLFTVVLPLSLSKSHNNTLQIFHPAEYALFDVCLLHTHFMLHTCTCPLLHLWLWYRWVLILPADSGVDIRRVFNYKAPLEEIVEILNR